MGEPTRAPDSSTLSLGCNYAMLEYPEPPCYFPPEVEPGSPRRRDGDTPNAGVYHPDSRDSLPLSGRFDVPHHSHSESAIRQSLETQDSGYKSRTCSNPQCETPRITFRHYDRDGGNLCDACGSFQHLHGKDSPVTLRNDDIIKRRKRSLSIESVDRASNWPPAESPIRKARRLEYVPRHDHASQSAPLLGPSPAGSPISKKRRLESILYSEHASQSPYMMGPNNNIAQVSQDRPQQAVIFSSTMDRILRAQLSGRSPSTLGTSSTIAQAPPIHPEQSGNPSTALSHPSSPQHSRQKSTGQFYIPHPSLQVYDRLPWHALRDVHFMIERITKLTDEDKCEILRYRYGQTSPQLQDVEEDQIADIYDFCKSVCATGRTFFEREGAPGQDTIAADLKKSLWFADGGGIDAYVPTGAEAPMLGTHLDFGDWIGAMATPGQAEMMKKEDKRMKGLLRPTLSL